MTNEPYPNLFGEEPDREGTGEPPVKARARSGARVSQPNRALIELRPCDLGSLLPKSHRAPIAWAYLEQSNLSPLYAGIKVMAGGNGYFWASININSPAFGRKRRIRRRGQSFLANTSQTP